MEKITSKFNQMYLNAYANSKCGLRSMKEKLSSEDGDTNFLSIIIVLAIVLVVAAVFIMFKDQILGLLEDAWNQFISIFNGQKGPSGVAGGGNPSGGE